MQTMPIEAYEAWRKGEMTRIFGISDHLSQQVEYRNLQLRDMDEIEPGPEWGEDHHKQWADGRAAIAERAITAPMQMAR